MAVRRIGFKAPWMTDEPEQVDSPSASVPNGLDLLRQKIAAKAAFIIGTGFRRLRKAERLEVLTDFADLQTIESDFARAVQEQ